jgi:hypothetical protein
VAEGLNQAGIIQHAIQQPGMFLFPACFILASLSHVIPQRSGGIFSL